MRPGSSVEAICIVGPTASGKSSLAEGLAQRLGTEIVSVDAMQVYRGMDIGTAKTPPNERKCPLHMVDVVDVDQAYSVALFQQDARACIDEILGSGRQALLCGGTGLYLDAVIDDMRFPRGQTGGALRQGYEKLVEREGAVALHRLLRERDPESATLIEPANVRRVVRALEMLDEGVSYASHHRGLRERKPWYKSRLWAITMDRTRLHVRIDERVDRMFERGLVREVEHLRGCGLERGTTAGQAIGYKEVLAALDGACSMEEARTTIKTRSRRYAKRQLSWLRRDGRCRWLDYDRISEDEAIERVLSELKERKADDRGAL